MPVSKVLLVDDDQDLLRIAQLSLCNVGKWKVLLAASGKDALKMAVEELPDVILLDVMMPQMDGLSCLKCLRQTPQTADIPVIFLTAKVQASEVDQYTALGAIGVIIKPFDPITLPHEIEEILQISRS
jgi:CheY-like chemotaxis protein